MVLGELVLLQQGVCHGSPVMSGSSVLVHQNASLTGNGLAVYASAVLDDGAAARAGWPLWQCPPCSDAACPPLCGMLACCRPRQGALRGPARPPTALATAARLQQLGRLSSRPWREAKRRCARMGCRQQPRCTLRCLCSFAVDCRLPCSAVFASCATPDS